MTRVGRASAGASARAARTLTALLAVGMAVGMAVGLAGCAEPGYIPSESPYPSADPREAMAGTLGVECTPNDANPDAITVLSNDIYRIGGWNHVNGRGSFETVRQEPEAYRIAPERYVPDETCDGAKTLSVLLARKTYDWDRQHANGMETQFPGEGLTFDDIHSIVLQFRIDPETTYLPTDEEYEAAYGDLLSDGELAGFDDEAITLEVTLFGSGKTATQPFMNASALVEVYPGDFGDGWVRVQFPRHDMEFYTEESYVRTPVNEGEYGDLAVMGMRINPEIASRTVVRSYVGDDFDPTAKPELFKEMGLTFAGIQVERQ